MNPTNAIAACLTTMTLAWSSGAIGGLSGLAMATASLWGAGWVLNHLLVASTSIVHLEVDA